jgi:hypothetical protein
MKYLFTIAILLSSFAVKAQTTILPTQSKIDGTKIPPGTTLVIKAGERGPLLFQNLKGTAEKPILIINEGAVTIKAAKTASYGMKMLNSRFFKVIGSIGFGFKVDGGNIGITFDGLSTNFKLSGVEVRNCGFAGIMAKTDPTCVKATQRGYFTMYDIDITYNYIHNVGGEAIYIGNSFAKNGVKTATCGQVFPHYLVNVNVLYNITDSTGCEGIQVGSANRNANVNYNTVTNSGLSPFAAGQSNGIQIGEGTGGTCFGNVVKNARANGIIVLGSENIIVSGNVIINSGENGIFADTRFANPKDAVGKYIKFINNTIVNSKVYAIKLNSTVLPMHYLVDNKITGNGIKLMSPKVKVTYSN